MAGRWSIGQTVKFINAYKSHPCLWDTKYDFYHSKEARKAALVDIALKVGVSEVEVDIVKAKIRLMRGKYSNELKKVRAAEASGQKYTPNSYWFDIMDAFLRDVVIDPRGAPPELITADSIVDSSCIYENGFGDDEDSMERQLPLGNVESSSLSGQPAPSSTSTTAPAKRPYRPGPACSKLWKSTPVVAVKKKTYRKKPIPTSGKEAEFNEDEFDAFGQSVSAQLRKLSLSRALRVQTEIQKILTDERISDLGIIASSPSAPSPTPPMQAPLVSEPLVPVPPVISNNKTVVSEELPDVSSGRVMAGNAEGGNIDQGMDSGVESANTNSISENNVFNQGMDSVVEGACANSNSTSDKRLGSGVESTNTSSVSKNVADNQMLECGLESTNMNSSSKSITDNQMLDSGLGSTNTNNVDDSLAELYDNIKTECVEEEPIEEQMSTSPVPPTTTGYSLPLGKQSSQPQDDIIHNTECEIITLDEEDPLKFT